MIKNQKFNIIHEVHQKIYTEQVLMLKIACSYIILHLNLKRLRFTSQPVTCRTHQSHMNVNHIGT